MKCYECLQSEMRGEQPISQTAEYVVNGKTLCKSHAVTTAMTERAR